MQTQNLLPAALLLCAFATTPAWAAQQVEIYSLSLRFQSSTATDTDTTWRLDLTSAPQGSPANGELALAEGANPFTHSGFLFLRDIALTRINFFPLSLNIPTDDNNFNGMFDVLEQESVTAIQTTGSYTDSAQTDHPIRATWNKAAESHTGSCELEFPDLGMTFTALFENIHYSGTYDYTKTESSLAGPIATHRNGVETSSLSGPLNLEIISPSQLAWGVGYWQTEAGARVGFEGSGLDRSAPFEYSAFYVTADGDLTTPVADYQTWLLVLPNIPDVNGNGIPDLIEASDIATGPTLTLTRIGNALTLTVTGGGGRTFDLETTSAISTTAVWTRMTTHTFTTDSETIPMDFSTEGNAFFRLKQK